MQKIATLLYKIVRRVFIYLRLILNHLIAWIILYCNNIQFQTFYSNGIPYVRVDRTGNCSIGKNFKMNNNIQSNPIGRVQRCIMVVSHGANLSIGENVGMSATAIVVHHKVIIGNNVKFGGGVCIYDTNFHSLDATQRRSIDSDQQTTISKPVVIEDNAFIGAHSTILKGVNIGRNSIVGACSVVTKDIPEGEIWAGNPAKFIKKLRTS